MVRQNCAFSESNLAAQAFMISSWRIVFSTFCKCMSFHTARVIRVVFSLPPGRLLYPGGFNRSTQHFIPKRKDGLYGDASRKFSELQTGARFIAVFVGLSERGGTPAQRAAKTSGSETPTGI